MRILIISMGSIGRRHLKNCQELLPESHICVWHHRHRNTGHEDGYTPVFTQKDALGFAPEAVIVASPASKHLEQAAPFIELGIPTFIEKPLADNTDGLDDFLTLCQQSQSFTMVGYVLRFMPIFLALKDHLDTGVIGKTLSVYVETGQYLPDWRPDSDYRKNVSAQKELGGGILLELSHDLDFSRWIFGQPHAVMASVGKLSDLEINVEDSAHVICEYPDKRVVINIDCIRRVPQKRIHIIGSEGTLEVDLLAETIQLFTPNTPAGTALDTPQTPDRNTTFLRQFDMFFAQAFPTYRPQFPDTRDDQKYTTVADAVAVMHLIDAIRQSDHAGKRVRV